MKIPRRSEDWAPLHIIAWRTPWFLLAMATRILLCALMFCGWGKEACRDAWVRTR